MARSSSPLPSQSWNRRETREVRGQWEGEGRCEVSEVPVRYFLLLSHSHNLLPSLHHIHYSLIFPDRFLPCGFHLWLLLTSPTLLDQLLPLPRPKLLLFFLSRQHVPFSLPHSHPSDLSFLPSHRHLPPRRTSSSSHRSDRQTQSCFRSREPRRGRGRRVPGRAGGTQPTGHKTSSSRERPYALVVAFEGKGTRDGLDHQRLPSKKGGRRERSRAEEMDQGRGGNYSLGSEGVCGPGSSRLRLSQSERGRRDG
ncbi:hypothetical protein BDY24DRAFT_399979, partial [Mrakia frigida]|uniref:uncharacterized protein n=1 Tax=Mrakia frigida TaxID=29902 RepID=UPI003FCC2229